MEISDPILYGLFFVEVAIEFELVLFFVFGWRREEREKKHDITLFLGLYFLLLAIGRIILIVNDFYIPSTYLWLAGTGISLLGMIAFIYLSETIIPKNTRYVFTILSGATLLSIFFLDPLTGKAILYIMLPFIFVIGFFFLGYLINITSGSVKYSFIIIFIGQIFFGLGNTINTDMVTNWFATELLVSIRPVGLTLIITALVLIALAFWRLPSLYEIEWHSKLLQLYVITNTHGICVLYHSFQEESEDQIDKQLISGGVSAIVALIKEMTSSKKHLKEIDHEDITILFEYGLYATTALLVKEELQIYYTKLKEFIDAFESRYKPHFIDWTGSLVEFESGFDIVTRVFEQKNIFIDTTSPEESPNENV